MMITAIFIMIINDNNIKVDDNIDNDAKANLKTLKI